MLIFRNLLAVMFASLLFPLASAVECLDSVCPDEDIKAFSVWQIFELIGIVVGTVAVALTVVFIARRKRPAVQFKEESMASKEKKPSVLKLKFAALIEKISQMKTKTKFKEAVVQKIEVSNQISNQGPKIEERTIQAMEESSLPKIVDRKTKYKQALQKLKEMEGKEKVN